MTRPSTFIQCFYIGINIQNILYGIELVLYFETMRVLLSKRRTRKTSNWFYALFSSVMLFLITIWVATQALFGQHMWIIESDFPGGADAYWNANITVWYMDISTIVVIVLQLMTDALMIYRCRIAWNSRRVVVVPVLLWVASLTMGVLFTRITSLPGTDYYTGVAAQLGLAYWTVSVVLNATLTCMLCYRLLRHAWTVQDRLGSEYASLYVTAVTIIVESVLPYTLAGVAFLVTFGVRSAVSSTFICVYFLMMCISPQMLILRVVRGEACNNDTLNQPRSTVKFNPASEDTNSTQCLEKSEGVHPQILSDVHLSDTRGDGRTS